MLNSSTLHSFENIVGDANILAGPYDLDRYSADALTPFRAFGVEETLERTADLVVRPSTTGQVVEIVGLAAQQHIPLIPYGGGTGVMGGTLPVQGGVILDLKRMNRVLEVSARDQTVSVEAGTVLQDLEDALDGHGLMAGHDPYSLAIATVGGDISTNGVGYRAGAIGPMGDQVVALEVVLPNGRVMTTPQVPKTSSGPNLNHLFIGSEGVFGVITRATLRVRRLPEAQVFSTIAFDNFSQGFNAVAELRALDIRPTLLDLTEEDGRVRLYLLFEGFREGVAAMEARTMEICAQFQGRNVGPEPTLDYWRDRHQSGDNYRLSALGKPRQTRWQRGGGRGFDYLHLALPISKVLEYRDRCEQAMAGSGVRVTEYAIWSRPELFSMLLAPEAGAGDDSRQSMSSVVEQVLTLAQDMGGVMEYCHGVGMKLGHLLAREMGVGHQVIRALKDSLDPAGIMNPSKLGL